MKNNNLIKKIIKSLGFTVFIMVIGLIMVGCLESNLPHIILTQRYETVPLNIISRSTESDVIPGLLYSGYDNNYYYYVFLLGHINYVPITYRNAVIYNGITPITIGYTKSNTTETTVKNAIMIAVENSLRETFNSYVDVSVDFGKKIFGFGAKVSTKTGVEYGWVDTETRSTLDTWETTERRLDEYSDSISVTIGSNNEPSGKYRYSLFATTDVYYTVIINRVNFRMTEAYTSLCVRPESFAWGIDYESDPAGNFGKTSTGNLLVIPELDYSILPIPTDRIISTDDTKILFPTYENNDGSIDASVV